MRGFQNKAQQYALKLLSYRGRSEKELQERLFRKGIPESEISSTIRHLKEIGLIDDISLAETLKQNALTARLLSRKGSKRFMLGRGIPPDIVERVFCSNEDTDFDNAMRFTAKKLRMLGSYPPQIVRRKLYGLLFRRGYSPETIVKVLKEQNLKEE